LPAITVVVALVLLAGLAFAPFTPFPPAFPFGVGPAFSVASLLRLGTRRLAQRHRRQQRQQTARGRSSPREQGTPRGGITCHSLCQAIEIMTFHVSDLPSVTGARGTASQGGTPTLVAIS
jgi:hypothetical protein